MPISEQQIQQLKSLFDYFDKDNSGSLDKNQLQQLIYMIMGQKPTQQQKLDLLALVDQDGNGSIEYQEFQDLFKRKFMNTNIQKQLKCAFDLIDIGKNNYITFQELQKICNQLNLGFTKEQIQLMINKGSNGNGKVKFKQFFIMMSDNQ